MYLCEFVIFKTTATTKREEAGYFKPLNNISTACVIFLQISSVFDHQSFFVSQQQM
jgi:hypothetical protein